MTAEEVKSIIIKTSKEIGALPEVMLMIAHCETGGKFNNPKGNTYWGTFQLSDGYGGCKGEDRMDVAKATACTWKNLSGKKSGFDIWEDWYYYGIHQQGLTGFKTILREKDLKINDGFSRPPKVLLGNLPNSVSNSAVYVRDWISYWRDRCNALIMQYKDESKQNTTNPTTNIPKQEPTKSTTDNTKITDDSKNEASNTIEKKDLSLIWVPIALLVGAVAIIIKISSNK